jgi:hypothetical protein
MVSKRSLRSAKKDSAEEDPPAEENKPKPTRTRSTRGRKKNQEETDNTPAAPPSQSEDVAMETDDPPAPDKVSEDVEMKTADDVDEKKDEATEEEVSDDTSASGMAPDVY